MWVYLVFLSLLAQILAVPVDYGYQYVQPIRLITEPDPSALPAFIQAHYNTCGYCQTMGPILGPELCPNSGKSKLYRDPNEDFWSNVPGPNSPRIPQNTEKRGQSHFPDDRAYNVDPLGHEHGPRKSPKFAKVASFNDKNGRSKDSTWRGIKSNNTIKKDSLRGKYQYEEPEYDDVEEYKLRNNVATKSGRISKAPNKYKPY